jgi:hypothetical protein
LARISSTRNGGFQPPRTFDDEFHAAAGSRRYRFSPYSSPPVDDAPTPATDAASIGGAL